MSLSKQDQLLEKLQKCVGKLQNRQRFSLQPNRQTDRSQRYDNSQAKALRQKYQNHNLSQFNNNFMQRPQTQGNKFKWQKQPDSQYLNVRQNKTRNNNMQIGPTRDYLTERRQPYKQQSNNHFQIKDRSSQIKKKYQFASRIPIGEQNKRPDSFSFRNNERPRKQLLEHDLNISNEGGHNRYKQYRQNKQNVKQRQIRYREQVKPQRNYENSASKYDSYNYNVSKPQKSYNINTTRRNSISYNQNLNRSYNKQTVKPYRNYDLPAPQPRTNKIQNHQIRSRELNNQNKKSTYLGLNSQPSTTLRSQRNDASLLGDQNLRQYNKSKQKSRVSGIGSIATVAKKPVVAEPTQNKYQTFQSKQIVNKQLNLKQILDDVGNANQDTFTKLQKISELNQRINQRIKNIINTFQAK